MSKRFAAVVLGTSLAPFLVYASTPGALWLEPSLNWYGIDGNWSSIGLLVGEPAQEVNVTVGTSSSEIWVVGDGGCGASDLCTQARGQTYNISASHSWTSIGAWDLGLKYLGLGGNGDYALETVVVYDSVRRWQTLLNKQVVAAFNTTNYYTGMFGLGILAGNFGQVVAQSPISALVETYGIIPSHSYGYTAGAYYAGSGGVPLSLTLGGYDAARFEPHDTKFTLNPQTQLPEMLVRGIAAFVSATETAPSVWLSESMPLLSFNESVIAKVDSSTAYLWLPETICDRFATSLNLTWNETFGLYLFSDNDNLERYRSARELSFIFTLSSADNQDNFGRPLDVPGIVNITISASAFVQNLRYPFMDRVAYRDPAIPYFPLRRAADDTQIIIGRSFLQEAYIITNYETSTFSIHQAKFPGDQPMETDIRTIDYTVGSPYPGPFATPDSVQGLTSAQIAGVILGVCVLLGAVLVTVLCLVRRKKKQQAMLKEEDADFKSGLYTPEPRLPKSPASEIFMKVTGKLCRKMAKKPSGKGVSEFAADRDHERYEMAAPLPPIELNALVTESGTYGIDFASKDVHANTYEVASQQIHEQLRGPVPEYVPRASEPHPSGTSYGKDDPDASTTAHHRPLHRPRSLSPASDPTGDIFSNQVPSPMSPLEDWTNYLPDMPSPTAFIPTRTPSQSYLNPSMMCTPPSPEGMGPASLARSLSVSATASTPRTTPPSSSGPPLPPASYQRPPIDPSKVICLGPLPNNIQGANKISNESPVPRDRGASSYDFLKHMSPSIRRHSRVESTADTLGSNFTVEEEIREAATRAACRLDSGLDLVHIPQPALNRYSWEDDG